MFSGVSNLAFKKDYMVARSSPVAEVQWFYKDLQDLLELTPKKDVLFIIGDWNSRKSRNTWS